MHAARWPAERKLDALLDVDLKSTIRCSRLVAARMRPGGCILNIGWDHATIDGMAGDDPELFAAVKAGVLGFSRSFARSVAPDVRVNVLCPGWIETAFGAGRTAPSTTRSRRARPSGVGAGRRTSRARRCGWRRRPRPSLRARRSTSTGAPLPDTLFVTGRLAEPALRGVLSGLDIGHQIAVMNISVAALMTPRWIARRLTVPPGVDNIVIPGLCDGDVEALEQATGLPVRKGPADVRSLPEWYGRAAVRAELGPRDVRVFAEINDVQTLSREQVIARAEAYRADGADVIDLGLSLDRSWLAEGPATIAALRERGLAVSIDTLDPEHIRMADAAGVDYVLSLTPRTIEMAADLRATPVLITDDPDDLDGLGQLAACMEQLGRPYLLDSILAPINSGFAASLARYVEVRRRHPEAGMLMGIGNLTELTEADSTGVTALLIGFCQEVGIGAVLTTEVIGWARGAVREAVLAAQVMHVAQREARPPKHIDPGLVTSRDESMRAPSEPELRAMQEQISDANYRLFADADWLYAFNGEHFIREANMYAVFEQLEVTDPAHAFYLGKELMKATIARGLRKSYRQEGPLDWGLLSFPEPRREDIR